MKLNALILLFCLICTLSCTSSKNSVTRNQKSTAKHYENIQHDGLSFENAILIKEKSESRGIEAEYIWIRYYYPGSKVLSQALRNKNGRTFDVIKILTAEGSTKDIFFDISNFFGKF